MLPEHQASGLKLYLNNVAGFIDMYGPSWIEIIIFSLSVHATNRTLFFIIPGFIGDNFYVQCVMQADEKVDVAEELTMDETDCLTIAQSSVQVNMDSLRFAVSIYTYLVTSFTYYTPSCQIISFCPLSMHL